MYWSWQVLHADCIVYDSIITPHAFPTGWLINAIDYLQHWWQGGITALLYCTLFVFQCVFMYVLCVRIRARKRLGIHRHPWTSTMSGKGGISQEEKKTEDTVRIMAFQTLFLVHQKYFLRLPDRYLTLHFSYSFIILFTNILLSTNYMPGTFFPTCTGKLT